MNRGFPGEVPLQSCPAINKTRLQTAAGSTCSLLCSLPLSGYVFVLFCFFFFFTKGLDVIFTCKNKNKNLPEELLTISRLLTIITNVKWDENETCATHILTNLSNPTPNFMF